MSSSKSPRNLISTIHFWSLGACKISLFWGKCFWNFLSSVLNYSFWMANFAARKWPECRILHHLSQGFRQRAWWAPNKLCGLPKLIWWGPIWPLKYFLSFKPWHMSSSSKGNVSFCHRSVSIVCHPLTFHILIFSSETPQPNELKLGRKHL